MMWLLLVECEAQEIEAGSDIYCIPHHANDSTPGDRSIVNHTAVITHDQSTQHFFGNIRCEITYRAVHHANVEMWCVTSGTAKRPEPTL